MQKPEIVVPEMKPLVVPAMEAGGYSRGESRIEYSPAFARDSDRKIIVNITRDQAREIAEASGYRLSTATEEQALSEKGYQDEAFDDNFSRIASVWNLTDTGLLKPKGQKSEYTKETKGRKYWLRIVTEGGKEVGELWVPEGHDRNRIIVEWSIFGLPTETVCPNFELMDGTENHFYFNPELAEVDILRYGRVRGFGISAEFRPSRVSAPGVGFRPVRGSVSEYRKD